MMCFHWTTNELGCTNTVKYKIEVDDSEPFKEHFRHIPPPLLDEVRQHINEMLEAGAIRPSNSPWCNMVDTGPQERWRTVLLH